MPSAEDRLDSWKEIAAYLKKGVRTVQRWEQTDGLPVRRIGQDRQGSVFAYKSELDSWWEARSRTTAGVPPAARQRRNWPYAAAASALVVAFVAWARWPSPPVHYRAVPLTAEHGWETSPTFSPDGRQVAYMWNAPGSGPHIFVKTIGSDSQHRLTSAPDPEGNPAWSPDGRWIAFIRAPSASRVCTVVNIPAAGGGERVVTDLVSASMLTWSPDGRWLLADDGPLKSRSIVAISVADGSKHTLTEPRELADISFGLTANGRELIFRRGAPGGAPVYQLPLDPNMKPVGKPRTVTERLGINDMRVVAGGREIIYVEGFTGEASLVRLRLSAGAKPETLYTAWGRLRTPAMSSDGRRIAFAASGIEHEEIWQLPLSDPNMPAAPLISSTHADMNPQYSPDGRQIAFHSTRTGASDIWIVDRDGANARRLTYTNARTTATPRWSPTGEWIAFESNQLGQSEVYIVPSRGGAATRLTNNPATDAIPRWSRDGKHIYFCSDRTGRFEVWRMPAFGGTEEQVTRDGGFTAAESSDGKWLYYSQTRNFGPVFRMPLNGGKSDMIIPRLHGIFFAATANGIYYEVEDSIWFWDSRSNASRKLFTPPRPFGIGLDVSPDQNVLLFTQIDRTNRETDLYLIDGVH